MVNRGASSDVPGTFMAGGTKVQELCVRVSYCLLFL